MAEYHIGQKLTPDIFSEQPPSEYPAYANGNKGKKWGILTTEILKQISPRFRSEKWNTQEENVSIPGTKKNNKVTFLKKKKRCSQVKIVCVI